MYVYTIISSTIIYTRYILSQLSRSLYIYMIDDYMIIISWLKIKQKWV